MTEWLWFCAGLTTLALIFMMNGREPPAAPVPEGHGIHYLYDDRTGLCFASQLHTALANVECTPEVMELVGDAP